jgi:hypothetical protein
MKIRAAIALAAPLLFGVPSEVFCGGIHDGTCRTIAGIVSVYPDLKVTKPDSAEGCLVQAFGPASSIAWEVAPEDAVRQLFGQDGWVEDPAYAADGPGTASFALWKADILCRISAGTPSGIDDGNFFADEIYEFDAHCTEEAEE